jgi:PAS domain S-box-containing protein
MEGVSELNMLAGEFLLARNLRPLEQWERRVASIRRDIRNSEHLFVEEATLLEGIIANLDRVEEAKNRLLMYAFPEGGEARAWNRKLVERSLLFFMLASQNLTSTANNLLEKANARINRLIERTIAYSLVFLLVFGGGIIATVAAVAKSIDKPIRALLEAAERIGRGRLDRQTGIRRGDEIGRFAAAFDAMVAKLREITVSRDELLAEMEERRKAEKALRLSESRYRAIFENSRDGFCLFEVDPEDGRRILLECNEAFVEMSGRTREELFGSDISRLQTQDRGMWNPEDWRKPAAENKPFSGTFSWLRPDGRRNYIEYKAVPVSLEGQVRFFEIDRDVTAAVMAGKSLARSENLLRTVIENVPVIIWAIDAGGLFTLSEGKGLADIGFEPGEAVGMNVFDIFADNIPVCVNLRRALDGEEFKDIVTVQDLFFDVLYNPVLDENGAVTGVIGVGVNISKRVKAEAALRESEERFRQLAENIRECFILKDIDGDSIFYVSPVFEDVWELEAEEAFRRPASMVERAVPEDRNTFRELLEMEKQGREVQAEIRLDGHQGARRWIWYRSFPVMDNRGKPYRVAAMAEDVTRRKRTEEQLRNLSLKVLSAQESERKRIGRELHDGVGQTLSAVKILLEKQLGLLHEQAADADLAQLERSLPYIEGAIVEIRRILLDLRPAMLDDLGLVAAVKWLCREFSARFKNIEVRTEISVNENSVDETRKTVLYRVLQEALNNVAKHSKASWVRVRLVESDGALQLSVKDDGKGFDPGEGAPGVGLPGMRERIELVSGSFQVYSARREGTEIRAEVPIQARAAF